MTEESDVQGWRYKGAGENDTSPLVFVDRKKVQTFIRFYRRKLLPDHGDRPMTKEEWSVVTNEDYLAFLASPLSQGHPPSLSSNTPASSSQVTPQLQTTTTGVSTRDVTEFKKRVKRDTSIYPKFQDDKLWDKWNMAVQAITKTHDVQAVLDGTYVPS